MSEDGSEFWGPFVAGSIGGMAGNFVGQPWDTLKVRIQAKATGTGSQRTLDVARRLVAAEGFFTLYRGTVPPLLAAAPVNAAIFGGYEGAFTIMGVKKSNASALQTYVAGCAGGATQSFVLTPLDLVKCKLQASPAGVYSGPIDCARKILRANGVKGLYSGFSSTFLREAPSFGLYFLIYEEVNRLLNPSNASSTSFRGAAASCLAGTPCLDSPVVVRA